MAALTADRNTPRAQGDRRHGLLAASTAIFAGALLMRNAAGFLVKGAEAADLVGVGRAEEAATSSGAAGALGIDYLPGVFRYANSEGGDEITIAEIGAPCFAVDDQTVAKTDDDGSRSIAGFVEEVDAQGVWVRFDEAAARAYATLTAAIAAIET